MLLPTTVAGSLPKPDWLAETKKLWPSWKASGAALAEAKRDATLAWLKEQETIGLDIVSDGEQYRQHFVHGFLERIEGVDFQHKKRIGIRDNRYEADCPVIVAPLRRPGAVHAEEVALVRANTTRPFKFTLPGPMTLIDTLADEHYRDRQKAAFAFAELLNQEARELARLGVDVIQFDEPAFNVYMDQVVDWGIDALHRAIEGLTCRTAVHICYGYGIPANLAWKQTLGQEWRQYEKIFPALSASRIDQVSVECANAKVPVSLLGLLQGKEVLVGCIDVATDTVETPEDVARVIRSVLPHVAAERIYPCTNCGMAPMDRGIARAKLQALVAGARLMRQELGR